MRQVFYLLAAFTSTILADVQFVQPPAGTSFVAGSTLSVSWTDSGSPPALADLTGYVIQLCAGGNEVGSFSPLTALKSGGAFSSGNTATGITPIDPAVGANSPNGYFLQMTANGPAGTSTSYSARFGLTGMTGTFPANVQSAIAGLGSTTSGPSAQRQVIAPDPVEGGATGITGQFAIPYNLQPGLTRYAPMAPQPGTKITAKSGAAPLHTTSNVPVATHYLPIASISTTVTQSRPVTVSSVENPETPAPNPNEAMQKWLARWKD